MNHLEYQELTARLTALTEMVKVFRTPVEDEALGMFQGMFRGMFDKEDYEKVERVAKQIRSSYWRKASQEVKELSGWMDTRVDSFVSSNQDRADRELPFTKDLETLTLALADFIDEANEPAPGMVGLFGPVLKRCNDWVAMIREWTHLDAFRLRVIQSEAYQEAVRDGSIIKPFTWTRGIGELAGWLMNSKGKDDKALIGVYPQKEGKKSKGRKWKEADKVFTWKGKLVGWEQLANNFY